MLSQNIRYLLLISFFVSSIEADASSAALQYGCKKVNSNTKCVECYPAYHLILEQGICMFDTNKRQQQAKQSFFTGQNTKIKLITGLPPQIIGLTNNDFSDQQNQEQYSQDLCLKFEEQRCVECAFRSVMVHGFCKKVSDYCQTWGNIDGFCTKCYDGYQLKKGKCQIAPLIPGCQQSIGGKCIKCAYRYYRDNEICKQVSGLCKNWNSIDGSCTDCYAGYKILSGTCIILKQILIQGCIQQRNGFCEKCAFRYYQFNGICKSVSNQCKSWNQDGGACTECYLGYEISGNDCVLRKNIRINTSATKQSVKNQNRSAPLSKIQSLNHVVIPIKNNFLHLYSRN